MTTWVAGVVWGALLAAAIACQLVAALARRTATLGAVLRAALSSRVGTVAIALAWAWFGWHTFAR